MKRPPRSGPNIDEAPNDKPNIEVATGRFRSGISGSVIIVPPEKTPADPRPAIARPIMKAVELGAAPHSVEPTSKIRSETKNVYFVEYTW